MKSETLDWLSEKAPTFGGLSEREKTAIMDFALLWSFFESRCLSNNASIHKIRDYVQQLPEPAVNAVEIERITAYFRARYMENGEYTQRYQYLRLERSRNPQEVSKMLLGEAGGREALTGCLVILYRYRNNLFHGEKWENEVQGQQENFGRATLLLRQLMDQNNL